MNPREEKKEKRKRRRKNEEIKQTNKRILRDRKSVGRIPDEFSQPGRIRAGIMHVSNTYV